MAKNPWSTTEDGIRDTHDSYGLRAQDFGGGESGVEGHVGQDVHDGHQGDGDVDGLGQVPVRHYRLLQTTDVTEPPGLSYLAGKVVGNGRMGENVLLRPRKAMFWDGLFAAFLSVHNLVFAG